MLNPSFEGSAKIRDVPIWCNGRAQAQDVLYLCGLLLHHELEFLLHRGRRDGRFRFDQNPVR